MSTARGSRLRAAPCSRRAVREGDNPKLRCNEQTICSARPIKDRFERHKQAWTSEEIQKLHAFAKKGMTLKAIAKALTLVLP